MKYTKPIALLTLGLTLWACGPSDPQEELEKYRRKISEYEMKIAQIEQRMDDHSGSSGNGQALAVETMQLNLQPFSSYLEVTGLLESVQDADISPETSGQIEEIAVKRGAQVRAGELLVRLNTELIEKNIAEVRTNLELATLRFEKQEELWQKKIGSEIQYLETKNGKEVLEARLATLEEQLALARITAPFPGIVENVSVKAGELASPGMPLLRLVNLDRMRVTARVSESYLNQVREGDEVELRFAAYPDLTLREKISRMGEVIDPETRTLILEVELKNRERLLKPNMLTSIRIEDYHRDDALVVPSIVLRNDFNGTFLFRAVSRGEGMVAEKVYVEPGITVQDQTEITGGIAPGDQVIVKGYHLVGEGTPLRTVSG
jgi:membrane fusion protein (multidrug efflux system)